MYAQSFWAGIGPWSAYEAGLLALGLALLAGVLVPQWLLRRHYTFPLIFLGAGALFFYALPGLRMPLPLAPEWLLFWERLTEAVVVISLIGAGLKIDQGRHPAWGITIRLLVLTMPLCILAVMWGGMAWLGLTLPAALLLGAALAPTDPVLAGDIQVSGPNRGDGNLVRFALTSEAGLNDGLAFPFVYLAMGLASLGVASLDHWWGVWLLRDVGYRVAVAAVAGVVIGWGLGRIFFHARHASVAHSGLGVMALALFLIAYGAIELLGGYGFIGAFVSAYVLRRQAFAHDYHHVMFEFAENLEHAVTVLTLFLLGGLAVTLWPLITLPMVGLALALILVIRPLAGLVSLVGSPWPLRDRAVIACYGIRGIGSVYYVAYASHHAAFLHTPQLWAMLVTVLILSSLLHGLSAIPVMRHMDQAAQRL